MDEMFEPKKKERLDKDFFKGFIFIFVLGLFLVVGTSYSLEFFKVNKNGASIQFTTSAISINVTGDNTVNTTLSKYIDSEGLLNGLTKELTITNTNANHGEAILKIERTSGVELSNLHYALIINNIVQKVDTVPSDGIIFDNVIMGNETLNVKVVLWVDNDYSGSDLTFNGTISSEIKRTYNLSSDILDDVIDFNNITTATNNYVSFNNEVYRIVKIEDDRIVICKNSDFDSTAASRVNSNKFNSSLTYTDNSIIYSHSTDNKNLYLVKTVNIKSGKGTSTDPIIFENNRGYLNDKKVSNYITYKDSNNNTIFTQPVYYGETNYIMYAMNDSDFQGWSTTSNGSVTNIYGSNFTGTSDTTLYAIATQTYTITYNLDGGTNNANNPSAYTENTSTIALQLPTKEGYKFAGWTGSNGDTPTINVEIPLGSTGNKTFTANWYEKAIITCVNPAYSGTAQTIASCSGGTISSNINQTDVGNQTITCQGDATHSDADSVTCSITKADAEITCSNPYYTGDNLTIATCSGGTLSNHVQSAINSYTVTCTGDGNHNTVTKSCSVANDCVSGNMTTNNNYGSCSATCGGGRYDQIVTSNTSGRQCSFTDNGGNPCNTQACVYYAYGEPTTSSTTDYTTLGKNVFGALKGSQKSVCIIRNSELHCFDNNNFSIEKDHVQQVFNDIKCSVFSSFVRCDASDFRCEVRSTGYVRCYSHSSSVADCNVTAKDTVTCG